MTDFVELGEVCRVEGGAGFPLIYQGLTDQQYPFFKVGDMNTIGNEREMRIAEHSISEQVRRELRAIAFPEGTIVFPKIGAAIGTNKKRILAQPSCVDNNVMALIPKKDIDFAFLYYLLQNKDLNDFANRGNPPSIRQSEVETWKIPLPPLPEQQRIAALLDRADRLRRTRRYAQQLSDSFLQAVFMEMFGDPVRNDKNWKMTTVSSFVAEFQAGKSILTDDSDYYESTYRVLKVSAVTWRKYLPEESKPVPQGYVPQKQHIVRQGDLLISRANTYELVGATAYVYDTPPNLLLPDKLWRFVWEEPSKITPLFVWVLFMNSSFQRELGNRATGTSGSMKNISMEDVLDLPAPLPPLPLQQKFARIVQQFERLRAQQREAERQAEHLFQTLLQRAFRGEV